MGYYPVVMDLTNKNCLIIGGGDIAVRKAKALLEAEAKVTVIASQIDQKLRLMNSVTIIDREYESGDTSGCALVFAATDNREVNAAVFNEAVEQGIPVNVVDDPELCSFIVPSIIRRGDLLLAVSTSGKSPSLSKKIRKELEQEFGPEYTEYVALLGELRDIIKARYASQSEREIIFNRLIDSDILDLVRENKIDEARKRALECI